MKNNSIIVHTINPSNRLARTAGLLLLLGCCLPQGQAIACNAPADAKPTHPSQPKMATASHIQKNSAPIDLDYFQSSDNPFRAD